jgi:hypothetical protein
LVEDPGLFKPSGAPRPLVESILPICGQYRLKADFVPTSEITREAINIYQSVQNNS